MYVKQRKSGLLMFALFSAVFLVTFYLYELPAAAVGYPVVICAVLSRRLCSLPPIFAEP